MDENKEEVNMDEKKEEVNAMVFFFFFLPLIRRVNA